MTESTETKMANEPIITVTGHLGNEPEYKLTPAGTPVTSFSIATTPRKKKNNEWVDGETMWFRVFVWNYEAASVANALHKGDRAIVTGAFSINTYTDKEGTERKSFEINADGVGIVPKHIANPVESVTPADGDPVVSDFPW